MSQIDGVIYTKPGTDHCEGYIVLDDYWDPYEPEDLGWGRTWFDALAIYHKRMTDLDGECHPIILKCRPTHYRPLWGKVERIDLNAET